MTRVFRAMPSLSTGEKVNLPLNWLLSRVWSVFTGTPVEQRLGILVVGVGVAQVQDRGLREGVREPGVQVLAVEGLRAGPVVEIVEPGLEGRREEGLLREGRVEGDLRRHLEDGAADRVRRGAEDVVVVGDPALERDRQALAFLLLRNRSEHGARGCANAQRRTHENDSQLSHVALVRGDRQAGNSQSAGKTNSGRWPTAADAQPEARG